MQSRDLCEAYVYYFQDFTAKCFQREGKKLYDCQYHDLTVTVSYFSGKHQLSKGNRFPRLQHQDSLQSGTFYEGAIKW